MGSAETHVALILCGSSPEEHRRAVYNPGLQDVKKFLKILFSLFRAGAQQILSSHEYNGPVDGGGHGPELGAPALSTSLWLRGRSALPR